ncbi:hypothetical protein BU16DRAFT_613581 [Lophium mytilinum]|uniref:EF-hand domain-containing protein n=1 Tax=Lophium mytilinum TaxID=390894 RepID=A0A6A6RDB8_9PEZI|nr:hypothetical protein BU16DRAFT_613581 [Lophium mytilinum]
MSATPNPYKPSPLSFNSPRTSPFRRPNSPLTSPATVRATTPTSSPLKPATPSNLSPEKISQASLRPTTATNASSNPPPTWLTTRGTTATPEPPTSPTRSSATTSTLRPTNPLPSYDATGSPRASSSRPVPLTRTASGDPMTKIPPPLLHSMRESFSVLDRSNTGIIAAADVADMLNQLGLDSSPASLSAYFPAGSQTMNLATYLNTLAGLLAPLSHPSELNAAFSAFDDDDSGQIDLAELKDALLHTAPEPGESKLSEREIDRVVEGFSGRKAFSKGGKGMGLGGQGGRGEVFRYNEFVASVTGGGTNGDGNAQG